MVSTATVATTVATAVAIAAAIAAAVATAVTVAAAAARRLGLAALVAFRLGREHVGRAPGARPVTWPATTVAAGPLGARDDDARADLLRALVRPLMELLGGIRGVRRIAIGQEGKALMAATVIGELDVLNLAKLAEVGAKVLLVRFEWEPPEEQLAPIVVSVLRSLHLITSTRHRQQRCGV